MIRAAILCALIAVPAVVCCQEAASSSGEELTLKRAIELAVQNNRRLENAALEVKKAQDQVAMVRTQRLPAFDFSILESQLLTPVDFEFKRGAFGLFPATGPIPPDDATISTPRRLSTFIIGSMVQPISQLYRIGLGIQMLEMTQQISQERLRLQRQSVVNEVKRVYYGLLQTQSALEATEEAIKFYHELDREVGEQVVQQKVLRFESLDVKTRLAQAEYEALTLRNSLASQKEQLNDLLGRDIRTELSVILAPDDTPFEVDLAAAHARALLHRPEVKEARLKVRQAEYDRRIKKSEYIPDISLAFNYISPYNVEVLPKNVMSVGLMFSWNPFDWGRKRRELAEKGRTIQQANNGLDGAETLVLTDVNNRFRKLQETQLLLQVGQLSQQAVREKLRVTMNQYTQQAALPQDLLQVQAALADANHQYRHALLSFWIARADFEKALGEE